MYSKLKSSIKKIDPIRRIYDWSLNKIGKSVRSWNRWKINFLWKYNTKRLMGPRLLDVFMMMIVLHIKPERVFKYSTHKRLFPKGAKYSIKERPSIFPNKVIYEKSDDMSYLDEISIIGRGSSFDLNQLKEIKHPIFAPNFNPCTADSFKISHHKKYIGDKLLDLPRIVREYDLDLTYAMTIIYYSKEFIEQNPNEKILFIHGHYNDGNKYISIPLSLPKTAPSIKWYLNLNDDTKKTIAVSLNAHPDPNPVIPPPSSIFDKQKNFSYFPTGTGLQTICALYPFAKKINIYGWDFHLKSSPDLMKYWELFFSLYHYDMDKRSRDHFESALINFYYGYHISKVPKIKVYGYLGQLDKHEKLINRIERVLYER